MAQTTQMQAVNMGDDDANYANIISSFNNDIYNVDQDSRIMRWLSPLEPNIRHQGVRSGRFGGIGGWLLETSEFQEWRECDNGASEAVLFCSGNPGVGKTYLSSLVIDSLCDQAKKDDIAVAFLYCDYLSHQEQTITNILGAVLKQLIGRGEIPKHVREAFQEGEKETDNRGPRLPDLTRMLRITIASLPQVFICIDALDECLPKHLPELLESLRGVVRESPRTQIFLTGRPHIKEDIQRHFAKAVVIPISPNTGDIKNYLEMRLDRDTVPEAMSNDLRADIVKITIERVSDIFLLVKLNIDAILRKVTMRRRRNKLEETAQGNGLSDAYKAILTRLKAQRGNKSKLGLKALMWVLHSERPLRAVELCHALGVEIGSTDLDTENVPKLRTLLVSCLGLLTVEVSSSTVRLVHFTLKEHLANDPILFKSPHSTIAEVCLTYLNFGCVRDLSPTLLIAPPTTPLLEYASCYWGMHTSSGLTENAKILALRVLDKFDEHISARLMLLHYIRASGAGPYFEGVGGPTEFTGLHGAAFLGIMGIFSAVLEMKEWDVNATDCTGSTALTWAARRGHEGVAKVLLECEGVDPDLAQTPLLCAAERGHEGVVKMLLGREVNPNTVDIKSGCTPLLWAAKKGHAGVVKMLLEREGVDPNRADNQHGQTPLSCAAEQGHKEVVEILLGREDVDPNTVDTKSGRTPVLWAAKKGHAGVVKMLLKRDGIDPNQADTQHGRAPLSWAAGQGHEGVVKMLLGREDVNPNRVDTKSGRTPLLWAAKKGHARVVKTLLEREGIEPNQADTQNGRTPLSWAAGKGHEGVVKVLLEREDVDSDTVDTVYGATPFSWAADFGHTGVIKMFLERDDVNPSTADTKSGRTPLSLAATSGNEGVVRILLQRADVNPNTADTEYGRTPLSWAAVRGHAAVVKILLEEKGVHNTTPDNENQTPLSLAHSQGHHNVVRILQERDAVNPDTSVLSGPASICRARERVSSADTVPQ